MMPLSNFPPDLNTPFNDMVGFLLRETQGGDCNDYVYIRAVSKTFENFTDLPHADIVDLIALCIRYGYFDEPMSRLVPTNDEFISMGDLLDGVARANGLGGYANE
ncbi:MAG: hypothetical protein DHS20C07_19010 [Methyloligella sp.]|nr:MAG: hypothetical protein DHS20C07_19010 [Methyloligella sp.]